MSFLAFMKILESTATRYDKGINLLFLGKINGVYNQLDSYVEPNNKILDLGCGTGSLTLRAASKGAQVKAIDINPEMIAICKKKALDLGLKEKVIIEEKGVVEITDEQANSYDIVMSGLCFSELSADEITFTLKESYRLLKPTGLLIIIDEVVPKNIFKRIIHAFIRLPVVIITYILTQTTTKALKKLPEKISSENFEIQKIDYRFLGSLAMIVAKKKS